MPEITCEHGHTMRIGTDQWVETLTLDQMRYARDQMSLRIQAAEAQPKRCVWRVCRGALVEDNYREEDFEKAADHLVRIFKEYFIEEAKAFVERHYGTLRFEREIPHLSVELVSQFEYDNEWFPTKP
ncbi:hypothetical protein NJH54_17685 [Pseudomonas asiatica]|uniref:hypothetical protein n=1 Tax=Pseudomonas TaxID=286 RepID=UPI00209B5F87|nr:MULTISPECIES: hypothetical protein [Pseudomonas]MCO7526328.1 hypothetical protein [Pseudomonas asiatica]MDS9592444.1 hypothetical protein [Pseudomonas sp. HTZ1]